MRALFQLTGAALSLRGAQRTLKRRRPTTNSNRDSRAHVSNSSPRHTAPSADQTTSRTEHGGACLGARNGDVQQSLHANPQTSELGLYTLAERPKCVVVQRAIKAAVYSLHRDIFVIIDRNSPFSFVSRMTTALIAQNPSRRKFAVKAARQHGSREKNRASSR